MDTQNKPACPPDDRTLTAALRAIGDALLEMRSAQGCPRIDVGIETTEGGVYFVASVWISLVRPSRIECPTAEMLVDSLYTIVEANR